MSIRLFRRAALAGVFTSLAPAAMAAFLYDCTMEDIDSGRGWISPKVAILVPGDGSISVIDALTLTFAEDPVPAKVIRDNGQRLIIRWSLKNVRADSGRSFARFDYRASLSKSTGRIEMTATPSSFDSGLRGTGSCRKRERQG